MQDERSTMQKMEDFSQAFSEFLRRPKTIFDMKDRFRLLVLKKWLTDFPAAAQDVDRKAQPHCFLYPWLL